MTSFVAEVTISRRRVRLSAVDSPLAVSLAFLLVSCHGVLRGQSAAALELFEKKIRPVLAEKCYACHSDKTAAMAGLRVDSKQGLLTGGSRGAAVVPGQAGRSLLLKAISYTDLDLRMPPDGKLTDQQIASFREWIDAGAPDPRTATAPGSDSDRGDSNKGVDIEEGKKFWSFQPIQRHQPPSAGNSEWPLTPVDNFLLHRLRKEGLSPAPEAGKAALLRRVTFDLIGLPPAPKELQDFLEDASPRAYERVVERLLASPHYGERWARHWLDLVRYGETNGHEFDNDKLDAWRYRDYVIRAFNDDLPYDVFVTEQIAGDLLAEPRLSADGSFEESSIGPSFYWFGEVLNSATDSVKVKADRVDNQIDVLGKAMLGLTLACARCHDHKFDPIPTSDYYALAGIMHSTEIMEQVIDSPRRGQAIEVSRREIGEVNREIRRELRSAPAARTARLADYLMGAIELIGSEDSAAQAEERLAATGLDLERLRAWAMALEAAAGRPEHVLFPLAAIAARLADGRSARFGEARSAVAGKLRKIIGASRDAEARAAERGDILFADFGRPGFEPWLVSGAAFAGRAPEGVKKSGLSQALVKRGLIRKDLGDARLTVPAFFHTFPELLPPNQPLQGYRGEGLANSFQGGSDRFVGSLTSAKFRIPKRWIHVRLAGTKTERVRDGYPKTRLTIVAGGFKNRHFFPAVSGRLEWQSSRLTTQFDRVSYFELVDRDREAHIVVDKIVFSDSEDPPLYLTPPRQDVAALAGSGELRSLRDVAQACEELFERAARKQDRDVLEEELVAALWPGTRAEEAAALLDDERQRRIGELRQRRAALESRIPASAFAMSSRDLDPRNVRVHLRGSHKNLGAEVPRGFLRLISSHDEGEFLQGSGRAALAARMTAAENPLLARVMVNRIWKHHFGQGLVRSVDNFGEMGERPSHPELLDYLAGRFIGGGWSLKQMHRLMVLSRAYRMSNQVSGEAARADPENRLLHHMRPRRLEAEVIRDSILAVAGRLDRKMFGPSVMPYISEHQDGRGKPRDPGPLDGEGRRSIYIGVRRNFLTPLFLAFDYPLPSSTIGRRNVSTVASQALMMMNNAFVARQAQAWADRVMASRTGQRERIAIMFLAAFARPASETEIADAGGFLERQTVLYEHQDGAGERSVWADLAHVLMNSTEFIFVP